MDMYQALGGEATFYRLTDAFYDRVAPDPLLRPPFPPDMGPGKRRLALFLIESLGGPPLWSQERDFRHLLRAHHLHDFTEDERDAWVNHMLAAIDESGIGGPERTVLREWIVDGSSLALSHRPRRPVRVTVPD